MVDASFFKLVDLNPWREEKVDEKAFLDLLLDDVSLVQQKYTFDAFDEDQLYPLHMICALGASVDCVKACYKAHPEALLHDDTTLGGPAHFACAFGATVDVVHYLAKKDPSSLEVTNSEKKTPLHLACQTQAEADVVIFLTERCPKAAAKKDKDGYTPLNLACCVLEPQLKVIEDLTEVKMEAGTMKANDGTWPLWNAMKFGVDTPVVKDLIVSNPEAAELIYEHDGSTVLHRALEKEMATSVLKDLMTAFPKGLETKDNEGRLPLHYAIESRADLIVIEMLVNRWPDSVEVPCPLGDIPHKMADRLGLSDKIVEFLNPYEEEPV